MPATKLKPDIEREQLKAIAPEVLAMVKTIRDWLPTESRPEGLAEGLSANSYLDIAAKHWTAVERIRNPKRLPFNNRKGFVFVSGPENAGTLLGEIWRGVDALAELYHWEGISDESSSVSYFDSLTNPDSFPMVSAAVLDRLQMAASGLLESLADNPDDAEAPNVDDDLDPDGTETPDGVIICGEEVSLTPQLRKLVGFVIRSRGMKANVDTVIDACWGEEGCQRETVDRNCKRANEKICDKGELRYKERTKQVTFQYLKPADKSGQK